MRWIPPLDVTAAEIAEAVEIFGETLACDPADWLDARVHGDHAGSAGLAAFLRDAIRVRAGLPGGVSACLSGSARGTS